MTILVAVKTGTDLVVAADSKVTVDGFRGVGPDGKGIWAPHTFDNGTKIAISSTKSWVAAIAGSASLGPNPVDDLIREISVIGAPSRADQDEDLKTIVDELMEERRKAYEPSGVSSIDWPVTTLLLFSADPEGRGVRSWDVALVGDQPQVAPILEYPGIWLAGSFEFAYSLLYGASPEALASICRTHLIPFEARFKYQSNYVTPRSKINTTIAGMPMQDAIDFAVAMVNTQITTERYLPGVPKCGGAVDVAIVHGFPKDTVSWFPGKEIRHPSRSQG